jgi:hypothetical protein
VNRDNLPYDQVNIICPVYAPGTSEEDAEKYIIYNVSPFLFIPYHSHYSSSAYRLNIYLLEDKSNEALTNGLFQ